MVRILSQDPDPVAKRNPALPRNVCEVVDVCLQRNRDRRPTAGALSVMLQNTVRELRTERFRRSGGRRQGDQPTGGRTRSVLGMTRTQFSRAIMVGAASGLVTGLAAVVLGYFLMR
jgi:serine/threonine-protein kinase